MDGWFEFGDDILVVVLSFLNFIIGVLSFWKFDISLDKLEIVE